MPLTRRWTSRRTLLIIVVFVLAGMLAYYQAVIAVSQPFVPKTRIRPTSKNSLKKVSVVHYTTMYSTRIDSSANVFSDNLKEICEMLDPEEYSYADGIVVTLSDFVRFPLLSDGKKRSYRRQHPSQLWLFHTEESPRNSYRNLQFTSLAELDDWFNLTATLKPDSDLHIQYKVRHHTRTGTVHLC